MNALFFCMHPLFAELIPSLCEMNGIGLDPQILADAVPNEQEWSDEAQRLIAQITFAYVVVRVLQMLQDKLPIFDYHEARLTIVRQVPADMLGPLRKMDESVWEGASAIEAAEERLIDHGLLTHEAQRNLTRLAYALDDVGDCAGTLVN